MNKRIAAVILVLVAGAATAAGLVFGRSGGASLKMPLDRVSASGTPIPVSSLSPRDRYVLGSVHASQGVRLLCAAEGKAFYLAETESGGSCFLTGPVGNPDQRFTSAGCLAAPDFPSAKTPILDDSSFMSQPNPTGRVIYLVALGGIAADGVARVGVTDAAGDYVSAPVHNNIYRLRPTSTDIAVRQLVAKDRTGRTIYSAELAP
jgi:hypothetical protein